MTRTANLWFRVEAKATADGLSQRRLARLFGCVPSTLSRWSRGKAPSAEVALAAQAWVDDVGGDRRLVVYLAPAAMVHVVRLHDTGLWGLTVERTAEELLLSALRRECAPRGGGARAG